MTECSPCKKARENPRYSHFNPACLHCGARIIQHLGTLPIPKEECSLRRSGNLAIWVLHGHSESEIRRLVKGNLAVAPEKTKGKK